MTPSKALLSTWHRDPFRQRLPTPSQPSTIHQLKARKEMPDESAMNGTQDFHRPLLDHPPSPPPPHYPNPSHCPPRLWSVHSRLQSLWNRKHNSARDIKVDSISRFTFTFTPTVSWIRVGGDTNSCWRCEGVLTLGFGDVLASCVNCAILTV